LRILICHGYLLRGTGSNQYVQSLARALCAQGHQLVVLCQEDDPGLDFVSIFLREEEGGGAPRLIWEKETRYPGNCMVVKPDVGGLLPVYVIDSYPGFSVKEFTRLSEAELESYVSSNRRALGRLVEQFVPDVIHVNHAVMLPHIVRPIAAERDTPYFVSIHGSAIDFAVNKEERYRRYAADGLDGARGILVPSRHSQAQLNEIFSQLIGGLPQKITVVPPGVDTDLFRPADATLAESVELMLESVDRRTSGVAVGDFGADEPDEDGSRPEESRRIERDIIKINKAHHDWLPEPDIAFTMRELARNAGPFVMFLGKLLETKGIQCVVPAMPLVLREYPEASLVVVGFGELRGILDLMVAALDSGDLRALKSLCDYGNEAYAERIADPFGPVLTFLDELAGEGTLDDYLRLCRELELGRSIIFCGYLTPEEHHHILGHARALLIPSLAPEAFGMVATEAMASGVTPIATDHSGLHTALEPFREVWGREAEMLALGTPEKLVFRIGAACRVVLATPEEVLEKGRREVRAIVEQKSGWEATALRVAGIFQAAIGSDPLT
jgi:glycosyltransferase involved in cell wall biosynthesis